jgi:hypothetical protein
MYVFMSGYPSHLCGERYSRKWAFVSQIPKTFTFPRLEKSLITSRIFSLSHRFQMHHPHGSVMDLC